MLIHFHHQNGLMGKVNMVLNVHRNHKARLLGTGRRGERGYGGGGRGRLYIYLPLHCHHENDSCIKMGRGESQSHKTIPQTTTFFKGKKIRSPGLMGFDESHFMCRVAGSEEMCVCVRGGGEGGVTQPYESSETV